MRVAVRGREQVFGGECVVGSTGVRLGCGDVAGGLGQCAWLCGGGSRSSAGNVLWGRRGMHRAAGGCASVREGGRKCAGRGRRCAGVGADLRRGMCCEVGGFNALSPQQHARTRIIILRPPRHRREIKAMGTKDAPCEHPSPTKTSAFAPSAFIFPPRRSHFPPHSLRPSSE